MAGVVKWGAFKWGQFKWGQTVAGAFVTEKNRHVTKGHLLMEIELDGKTLYLTDSGPHTATNKYEPLVLDWGNIDTSRSLTQGLGAIGDSTIILANKKLEFMSSTEGDKFSDLLDDYFFDYRPVTIKQWFEGITLASAVTIFKGGAKISQFDIDTVELQVVHVSDLETVLPLYKVNKGDHPQAPDGTFGQPIPISFGDWSGTDPDAYRGPFMPGVLTNKNDLRVDLSEGWEVLTLTGGGPYSFTFYKWVDELDVYMAIDETNFTVTSDDDGSYIEMNPPVYGNIFIVPQVAGAQNNVANWQNAAKPIGNTDAASLDGDNASENKLSLKFGGLPNLGAIQDWSANNIRLWVEVDSIGGGAGTAAIIKYYNVGYDDNIDDSTSFSTGQNITATGTQAYPFARQKEAHGVGPAQEDQNNAWTWDELGSYEYYIEAQAGFTLEISAVYLQVNNFEVVGAWSRGILGTRTRKRR